MTDALIVSMPGYYGSEHDLHRVHQASVRAGNAGAKVVNLLACGRPEQALVWEQEQAAWLSREEEIINSAALGQRFLHSYAAATIYHAFQATKVH
jgi:hypothetical protein